MKGDDLKAWRNERFHDRSTAGAGDQRTPAQRDRDRIIYSGAFRRLALITQVVSPDEGYVVHNRLTHVIKVAQVGRRLAEMLCARTDQEELEQLEGLDPEVVEAACLAHDLGHPPFGHIAETTLQSLLDQHTDKGAMVTLQGFEGNAQSFRIVTRLEVRREGKEGLDLTRATLNALLKYPWKRQTSGDERNKWGFYATEEEIFEWVKRGSSCGKNERSLEAELMDWADDIAYSVHDVEDFYRAGKIPLDRLAKSDAERERFRDGIFRRRPALSEQDKQDYERIIKLTFDNILVSEPYSGTKEERGILNAFCSSLIQRFVTQTQIRKGKLHFGLDEQGEQENTLTVKMLKQLVWQYVIEDDSLAVQQHGQAEIIRFMFQTLLDSANGDRRLFPPIHRRLIEEADGRATVARHVADCIASMSEHQIVGLYRSLRGMSSGSVLTARPAL